MSSSLTINNGNTLSIYRPDNARALQFYTTVNECIIDSWEASSEPLHIRSMGSGGRIQFFTSGSERMRITSTGNVGIGTTSPSASLETRVAVESPATNKIALIAATSNGANDIFRWYDGATQLGVFKNSGNVGIGTTSPGVKLNTFITNDLNTIQIRAESDTSSVISYTGIAPSILEYYRNGDTGVDLTIQTKIGAAGSGGNIIFAPSSPSVNLTPVERMRISKTGATRFTNGDTLVGSCVITPAASANTSGTTAVIQLNQSFAIGMDTISSLPYASMGGDSAMNGILFRTYSGGYAYRFYFYANGTAYNSTGTWGNNSDIKLKQDIIDASSQWDDIKSLKFKKYRLKKDVQNEINSTDGFVAPTHFGLIAQDVEQTSPGLVEEVGDDDGGTTKMLKTSIMLMKSVKALQEAMARIETLEERLTALENN
jgi:hypothetical protein